MSPIEKYNKINQKYPFLFMKGYNEISNWKIHLNTVGYYLNIYNTLIKCNDTTSLKILGLKTYKEDLKWILENTREERRKKLKKIEESQQ
jgi:hypothetical protein